MKKCTLLMTLAAVMVVAPMMVSAQTCSAAAGKTSCCPVKDERAKEACKDASKCPAKAACSKEGCEKASKCSKAAKEKKAA